MKTITDKMHWLYRQLDADAESKGIGQGSEGGRYCLEAAGMIESQAAEIAALRAEVERLKAAAVPAGWQMVPTEPTKAILRPFYECPADELPLAYQATLSIAQKILAAAPATSQSADAEDAARYRWLRNSLYRGDIAIAEAMLSIDVIGSCPSEIQFDSAIDAARGVES